MMFDTKYKIPNTKYQSGFTVVELMVSMALFVVLTALSAGTFIQTLRTQRLITALSAANNNATQTIEQIAREVRTGFIFSVPSTNNDILKFTNYKSEAVVYKLVGNSVGRCIGGAECDNNMNFKLITPPEVKVKSLKFILKGAVKDDLPPRVTMLLGISTVNNIETNLQTTVSARTLIGD